MTIEPVVDVKTPESPDTENSTTETDSSEKPDNYTGSRPFQRKFLWSAQQKSAIVKKTKIV